MIFFEQIVVFQNVRIIFKPFFTQFSTKESNLRPTRVSFFYSRCIQKKGFHRTDCVYDRLD